MGSSAIWCFKGSDVIEIRDGITIDFYTELLHVDPPKVLYGIHTCRQSFEHLESLLIKCSTVHMVGSLLTLCEESAVVLKAFREE